VAEAVGRGRELVGNVGIHLGVVAGVGVDGAAASSAGRNSLKVMAWISADDEFASSLVDLLVGELGVGSGDFFGPLVVLANEERVDRSEFDVFVGRGRRRRGNCRRRRWAAGCPPLVFSLPPAMVRRLAAVARRNRKPSSRRARKVISLICWRGLDRARAGGRVESRAVSAIVCVPVPLGSNSGRPWERAMLKAWAPFVGGSVRSRSWSMNWPHA